MPRRYKTDKLEHYQSWAEPINFYKYVDKEKPYHNPFSYRHGISHPALMLLSGASGSGKTTCLLNIIRQMNCFKRIYVFTKMPDEPLYNLLSKMFKNHMMATDNIDDLPDLTELKSPDQGLVVFDDFICESAAIQKRIAQYAIACRKCNLSCAFLTQSYYAVPRMVRLQTQYIFLLHTNAKSDFNHIAKEYAFGATPDDLRKMYDECNRKKSFFWIDCHPQTKAHYRDGFAEAFLL